MKRIFGRRLQRKEPKRILLTGTESGTGTTRFALALANAAASRERRRTLYIEVGRTGGIASLRTEKTFASEGLTGFCLRGVHYLPGITGEEARRVMNDSEWDVVICDVTESEEARYLFEVCDKRLVLCNLSPWHYSVFQQSMKHLIREKNEKRVEFCSFGLLAENEKRCREEFGLRVTELPELRDPFRMTHDEAAKTVRFL